MFKYNFIYTYKKHDISYACLHEAHINQTSLLIISLTQSFIQIEQQMWRLETEKPWHPLWHVTFIAPIFIEPTTAQWGIANVSRTKFCPD